MPWVGTDVKTCCAPAPISSFRLLDRVQRVQINDPASDCLPKLEPAGFGQHIPSRFSSWQAGLFWQSLSNGIKSSASNSGYPVQFMLKFWVAARLAKNENKKREPSPCQCEAGVWRERLSTRVTLVERCYCPLHSPCFFWSSFDIS